MTSQNGMVDKARIFLVDDHPLVRHGLGQLINQQPDLVVCGEAEDAPTALSAIGTILPDAVILDLSLDKDLGGVELLKDIKSRYSKVVVLILSMHDEAVFAERVLKAGAHGYVMKEEAMETVLAALRRVLKGEIWVSPRMTRRMLAGVIGGKSQNDRLPLDRLTDREMEVLQLIGRGIGTSQIAEKLHLSVKTIETHRAHIKDKLNLPDAAALNEFAIQWAQSQSRR
jgi:DNA-binding NarL/FixJ family response regulator